MKREFLFIIVSIILLLSGCGNSTQVATKSENGKLDLSAVDLNNSMANLSGEWEKYPNLFITSKDFESNNYDTLRQIVSIPENWSGSGICTYRLTVKLPKDAKYLGLKTATCSTAFDIYFNGKKVTSDGVIGKTKEESKPSYHPHVTFYKATSQDIEIIIHVSNFHHRNSGFWQDIYLSSAEEASFQYTKSISIDIFLIGSFFIMFIYHLGLYFLRRKEKSPLFFALIILILGIRTAATGEYIVSMIPGISWNVVIFLEYISFIAPILLFFYFMKSLFPDLMHKIAIRIMEVITYTHLLAIIVLPTNLYTYSVDTFLLPLLLGAVYLLVTIIRALIKKRDGALSFLIGGLVFTIVIVNDLLYTNLVINTMNLTSVGIFVFIFSQAFVISLRFTKAFVKTENLTGELNYMNKNLESIVDKRTKQVEEQKHEIMERHEELLQQNEEINAQKEELLAQGEEMSLINSELEKLSIVASKTDNAVVIMNERAEFEWFNEGFSKLYGYTFEEFTHKYKDMFAVSSNSEITQTIKNCIQEKKTFIYESVTQSRMGDDIWVQTTLTPILDSVGNIRKIIAIDSDIRKLKLIENELQDKNRHITDSIKYAKTIQTAILPFQEKIGKYFDNFILFKPKDIVSGDFYWYVETNNYHFVATVDCTGHGVPGAFMSMIGSSLLNQIVLYNKEYNTANIMTRLHELIVSSLRQDHSDNQDGMDICLCRIEKNEQNSIVQFTGAKRPLFYSKNGKNQVNSLKSDRKSIGGTQAKRNETKFTTQELQLSTGDMIYLSTDGYADQNDVERAKFGTKQLVSTLEKLSDRKTEDQYAILDKKIQTWMLNTTQRDDITLIGLKM